VAQVMVVDEIFWTAQLISLDLLLNSHQNTKDRRNMAIKLLTPPHNFAVCKMEDRNYPGVVFQGDSLFALYGLLRKTLKELETNSNSEFEDRESVIPDLEYEIEKFKSVLDSYEQVLEQNGFDLPYVKPKIESARV
jgi:hypothetical protein